MTAMLECFAPGWCHVREPRHELAALTPQELLDRTAALPGTFRLALLARGHVEERGEKEERVGTVIADRGLLAEVIATTLEEMNLGLKRRDVTWVIPVSARVPAEIVLSAIPDGLRVAMELVRGEPAEVNLPALALFLCRAQAGLRFARCELTEGRVVLASQVSLAGLESGLGHAIAGVLAGGKALLREAQALLLGDLAGRYLDFFARQGVRGIQVGRI